LAVTAPVVIIASPPILFNLPNIPIYVYNLFPFLFTALGIKRRKRPWGIAYNSISKDPLSLVVLRLIDADTNKLVQTQVTDTLGRFSFIPKPGRYYIEARKPNYVFPSTIVKSDQDFGYQNIYRGRTPLEITEENIQRIILNVPLDPADPRIKVSSLKLIIRSIHNFFGKLALPILVLGLIASGLVYLVSTNLINGLMLAIYILLAVAQVALAEKILKPWGKVYNSVSLEAVPLAKISVIDTDRQRVLKSRLSDYEGRFNFLPPEGKYQLKVEKEGYNYPAARKEKPKEYQNPYYGEEFQVKKGQEIVNADVPVDPVGAETPVEGTGRDSAI